MNYFKCSVGGSGKGNTVIVTCAEEFAGQTIVLAKIGKRYTKTCPSTSPYEVRFYGVESGTYTVSATVQGQTYSETVVVQDVSCVLNYGFTWKTWVDTASQLDSTDYALLSEVLADEKAVRELFTEHACVDYMADSTSSNADLETIIDNDLCAKWINNSDYALDFLGANTVIKALMDTADKYGYGEWTLMPQVPTMTSNTAPYGVASASSENSSSYAAWKAFDGDNTKGWIPYGGTFSVGTYLRYAFTNPIKALKAHVKLIYESQNRNFKYKIQGSNDGSTWTDVSTEQTLSAVGQDYDAYVDLTSSTYYLQYQLVATSADSNTSMLGINLQFYAWGPKGNVPVMTANTAPYGEASASSANSSYPAWKAFDGDDTTSHRSTDGTSNVTLTYQFTNPICANKWALVIESKDTLDTVKARVGQFMLKGSNDASTWELLDTVETSDMTSLSLNRIIENNNYYLYYRLEYTKKVSAAIGITTLQFYGRELSVSVPTMTSNTAPFGEAFADSAYVLAQAYKIFDGDDSTYCSSQYGYNRSVIGYKFNSKVRVKFIKLVEMGAPGYTRTFKIQASNDDFNNDIVNLADITFTTTSGTSPTAHYVEVSNIVDKKSFRALCEESTAGSGYGISITTLQFYGKDYSEKEFEVGTTKKWLYDHGVELETISMNPTSSLYIGTVEKLDSVIRVTASASMPGTHFRNGIRTVILDLTPYSLLRGKIVDSDYAKLASNIVRLAVEDTGNGNYDAYADASASVLPNNIGVNISAINGNNYVEADIIKIDNDGVAYYMDVAELWLE